MQNIGNAFGSPNGAQATVNAGQTAGKETVKPGAALLFMELGQIVPKILSWKFKKGAI